MDSLVDRLTANKSDTSSQRTKPTTRIKLCLLLLFIQFTHGQTNDAADIACFTDPENVCNEGYVDRTNGRSHWWACGDDCEGGIHRTSWLCQCACVLPTVEDGGCWYIEQTNTSFFTSISPYPIPTDLYGFGSAIYNDELTFLPRYNDLYFSAPISPYNGSWSRIRIDYPQNVTFAGYHHNSVIQVENLVYFINPGTWGGSAISAHEMFIYNLETGRFRAGPQPLRYAPHGCAAYDKHRDLIFYFAESDTYGGMQVYDIETRRWSQRDGSPSVEVYFCGCSMNSGNGFGFNLYQFGGYDPKINKNRNIINRYNVHNNEWMKLNARLSQKREGLFCAQFADFMIYCFGGRDDNYIASNVVDVFDPVIEEVVDVMYMQYAREYPRANLYGDCMLISGGQGYLAATMTGRGLNDDYIYDIEYFGECSNFTGPYEECGCYQPSLLSVSANRGVGRCYTYSIGEMNDCEGVGLDWIVLGRPRGCKSADAASMVTSISPSGLTVDPEFNGGRSGTIGVKIDGLNGIDEFTICFERSQVFGIVDDGEIGYGDSYMCSAMGELPDFCAPPDSEVGVGVFGFDTHNDNKEEPMMMYVWSGLSAAFASMMVVLIAYFCFIKSRTKAPMYDKVILDVVESDDE